MTNENKKDKIIRGCLAAAVILGSTGVIMGVLNPGWYKNNPKPVRQEESVESSASLVKKVLDITENRDGKPGISFEEQAWMAKQFGYGPVYEGNTVTLGSDYGSAYIRVEQGEFQTSKSLTNEDLTKFIKENETEYKK